MSRRFEVHLVELDPAVCAEIKKPRPGLSHARRRSLQGRSGPVVLDQIRTVDECRLVTKLGRLDRKTANGVRRVP